MIDGIKEGVEAALANRNWPVLISSREKDSRSKAFVRLGRAPVSRQDSMR